MSRGLAAGNLSAVTGEVVTRTMAVALDFPSGIARWNGSTQDIVIGGQTFLGLGVMGSIGVIEEGAETRAYGLTVSISGVPRDAVALALTQEYQGRAATIWEVQLNANGQPIGTPPLAFRGRMDQMSVTLGDTASVTVRLENRLADWERPRVRRYTDEDQQRAYPGDLGFQFVTATVDKDIVWPAANWTPPR
jgi:hypothetical protein